MRYTLLYYYNPNETGPTAAELPDWMELDRQAKEAGFHVPRGGLPTRGASGG